MIDLQLETNLASIWPPLLGTKLFFRGHGRESLFSSKQRTKLKKEKETKETQKNVRRCRGGKWKPFTVFKMDIFGHP